MASLAKLEPCSVAWRILPLGGLYICSVSITAVVLLKVTIPFKYNDQIYFLNYTSIYTILLFMSCVACWKLSGNMKLSESKRSISYGKNLTFCKCFGAKLKTMSTMCWCVEMSEARAGFTESGGKSCSLSAFAPFSPLQYSVMTYLCLKYVCQIEVPVHVTPWRTLLKIFGRNWRLMRVQTTNKALWRLPKSWLSYVLAESDLASVHTLPIKMPLQVPQRSPWEESARCKVRLSAERRLIGLYTCRVVGDIPFDDIGTGE